MNPLLRFLLLTTALVLFQTGYSYSVNDSLPDRSDMDVVIGKALSYLGVPYRYGGLGENGIDCSGLILRSFESIQYSLPHSSAAQAQLGRKIAIDSLQAGDVVFFRRGRRSGVRHVGMVVYRDEKVIEFVHASSSQGVSVADLNDPYWRKMYITSRRWWVEGASREKISVREEKINTFFPIRTLPELWKTPFAAQITIQVDAQGHPVRKGKL